MVYIIRHGRVVSVGELSARRPGLNQRRARKAKPAVRLPNRGAASRRLAAVFGTKTVLPSRSQMSAGLSDQIRLSARPGAKCFAEGETAPPQAARFCAKRRRFCPLAGSFHCRRKRTRSVRLRTPGGRSGVDAPTIRNRYCLQICIK